jgi:DNA-binding CsgD family transcriptional regulator
VPAEIDSTARADIAFYAAQGLTRREIADAVGVSRNTVRKYLRLVRAEVDASDDPRATLCAIVRDEYDWVRSERERARGIGFADRPM